MAGPIPTNHMNEEALRILEDEYEKLHGMGWAVTVEYLHDTMETRIVSIERWDEEKHVGKPYVFFVSKCRDEIDAYKKAKRMLEQYK